MALAQLNLESKTKLAVTLDRIREFEPPAGYYLAFSGGKDSVVVYDLAVKAGVRFDPHYSVTGIDPPELVQFIRSNYNGIGLERPRTTMWRGIQYHGLPFRIARWCCAELKECHGAGRYVLTGIRWQESVNRRRRRMVEVCHSDKTKIFVNAILDWTTSEVWQYIRDHGLAYCSLYDEGFTRLGCVLCPMQTRRQTLIELERWPKLAEAWRRACYRWWSKQTAGAQKHATAEDFWQYWLLRKPPKSPDAAQCSMFDN